MRDEDVGVLSMMRGKDVVEEAKADRSTGPTGRSRPKLSHLKLEDHIGMSQEAYTSWSVNCLGMPKVQKMSLAMFTISRFHEGEGFAASPQEATLKRFVQVLEREYLPNPYHNFSHAVDVLHVVARIMRLITSEVLLSELEQYSLLIAAIGHDMGHPGVNNGFLSEVGHELALQYNDRSPLENMHCAKLYAVLGQPETDIFAAMSKVQLKEVRRIIIDAILHTDMMSHQSMVKDLQATYQANEEVFTENVEASVHTESEVEVLSQPGTKTLIMNVILHGADVSNTCRSWEVTYAWANATIDEFFDQGDREKEFGIPVQFLNDRDTLNRPNSQIGFIEFMITPFFAAELRILRGLGGMAANLLVNIRKWEELWVQEARPPEEERHKVRTRVDKVQECIDMALRRADAS
jgi:cAMP-specific phosphodiesterase 4